MDNYPEGVERFNPPFMSDEDEDTNEEDTSDNDEE